MNLPIEHRRRRREIRGILYSLKRRFGVPVDYYQVTTGTPNVETGERGADVRDKTAFRRVPVFHVTSSLRFEYDLSFIAANKNFTYGALFEVGDAVFLFDEFPTDFDPQTDDQIIYLDQAYAVHRWDRIDTKAGFLIHGRRTQGVKAQQQHQIVVQHSLEVTQTITAVVE